MSAIRGRAVETEKGNTVGRTDTVEGLTRATHDSSAKLYPVFEMEAHPFPFGVRREIVVSYYCPVLGVAEGGGRWELIVPLRLGGCVPTVEVAVVPDSEAASSVKVEGEELVLRGSARVTAPRLLLFLADVFDAQHFCAHVPEAAALTSLVPSWPGNSRVEDLLRTSSNLKLLRAY